MPAFVDDHVLRIVIGLPAATALLLLGVNALVVALLPFRGLPDRVWGAAGIAASGLTFALAVRSVLLAFDPEQIGHQLVEHVPWIPSVGVSWFVGVDGISLFLVLLTTGLVPLTLITAWHQIDRALRSFVFCVLVLETGLLGVFLALDAALFFVSWQLTLLPVFLLIGIWGGSRRVRAAMRFMVVWGLSSALLLLALLAVSDGGGFALVTPPGGTAPGLLDSATLAGGSAAFGFVDQAWLFVALLAAFGLTVPIVPLHGWLLDAESEAPMAAAALLTAVGFKVGAYGLLRLVLPLCPDVVDEWRAPLFALSLVTIVYGSLLAAAQADLRRLVAWWTVAQLGFVLLGIFSLQVHGLVGVVVAMLSHGLTASALLVLVGAIADRRGTVEISAFGGLARPMPVFAALFGLAMLSAMGTPALAGFVGDLLIVLAGFGIAASVGIAALVGWVLGAATLAWVYRRVALGPVANPENRGLIDLGWRERGILLALLVPLLWIGVHPNPVLRRVEPSVLEWMRLIDERRVEVPTPIEGAAPGEPMRGGEAGGRAFGAREASAERDA